MAKNKEERVISASEAVDVQSFGLPVFANARHIVKHRMRDAERRPPPKPTTQQSAPAPAPVTHQPVAQPSAPLPSQTSSSAQPSASPPAAMDADQLQEQGFQAGFNEGKQLGWQTGLEEGKTAGYQEGLTKGQEDGYQQGLQQGQEAAIEELHKQMGRLQQLINALYNPIADQDEALTQQLVNIAIAIAKQVVQRELQLDSSQITTVVRAAIQAMPITDQQIKVFLNPQDIDLINEHVAQQGENWQLLPDDKLLPGGCRVETANSLVDASVEARLSQLTERLAEQHLHTHAQTIQQQPVVEESTTQPEAAPVTADNPAAEALPLDNSQPADSSSP
ncbi:flagellar assembly protein FliH [Endozoicomonas sp. SM1973]|uniref:Flagellar assembly protein FliH n=1 Tax=Spartinivicinus marinus TaxID=2994442 RepID=A0A853I5V9_9GAMM|nr:flagellar assembly protein FliH [Spartinivicinus marinus]MCX4028893.1 flagellar assembly protein FliH [Spartinivicinus marinus]NYZ65524.1 flagellar assembly protein FliH [Spartinivicinus marinus]